VTTDIGIVGTLHLRTRAQNYSLAGYIIFNLIRIIINVNSKLEC